MDHRSGFSRRHLTAISLFLGSALCAVGAQAQSREEVPGEIVVTSQKRTERLQDVPLAVTALSGDTLTSRQINDTNALANAIPSLTYTQNNNVSNSTFRIRGIGTSLFNQGSESSVSTVVDGVVLARQAQGFVDLADIERVEVLRGPQGTLFGKNATGGVISVVTARPTHEWTGRAEATIAEQDEYRVKGTVSGPLADTLRARLSGFYNDVGGHIDNVATGKDKNGFRSWGLRGKLDWDATERLNLLLTADYRKTDADCCQPQYLQVTTPLLASLIAPVVAGRHNRQVNIDTPSFNDTRQWIVSLEGNLELGDHTLTSVTAWQKFDFDNNVDVDGLPYDGPLLLPYGQSKYLLNGGPAGVRQFTQELRLTSPEHRPLTYVLGLYYLDLDLTRSFRRRLQSCAGGTTTVGAVCPNATNLSTWHEASGETRQWAAFGQAEWNVIDRLSLIGGWRLQRETVRYAGNRPGTALVSGDTPLMAASIGDGSTADTDLSGKIGLQYRFSPNAQAYVTWTRGYKGAAYDLEVSADFANQRAVRPETVKAWEAGVKLDLFDRLLTVNTALFYADYTDLQVQAAQTDPVTNTTSFVPTNAGSARTKGVEIEFTARPARGLTLSGGGTYLDASVDVDGLSCPLYDQGTAAVRADSPVNQCYRTTAGATPLLNVRDGRIPNSPKWRGTATLRYESDIAGTDFAAFGQLSGNAQSRIQFALEQDRDLVQAAYATFDLSLGLRRQDGRYGVTLFARNLTNQHFVNGMGRASVLTNAANPYNLTGFIPKDADRYFGATFTFSY